MSMTVKKSANDASIADSDRFTPKIEARPRRTLNRLASAVAGVALGAVGQYFFSQQSLEDGLLFYAMAVILFSRALARQYATQAAATDSRLPILADHRLNSDLSSGWRLKVGVWLIIVAFGISLVAYGFFGRDDGRVSIWWLYLGSLILFVTGGVLLTRAKSWRDELKHLFPSVYASIGLAGVLIIALLLRLYNFADLPFGIWFDEAEAGLQARRMLQLPSYRPLFYVPINISGHLLALYALALHWLGDTIQSMRLISVGFGLGGVVAAYLFGRELRGARFGLAMAFFVAVARWHINFSRIAMTGIDTPFFEFLSLFFLTRWLRRGQLRDAMAMGLALGCGLIFYTAFRLFVLALIVTAIMAAFIWWQALVRIFRRGAWPAYLGHTVVVLLAGWLMVMPLVHFAVDQPEAFLYRTRQISIFSRRDQPEISTALFDTAGKHLLMFNFEGDKNGRHNLPGEPMLDPVMAVLFVLGLGLAVAQLWSRRHALRAAHLFFLILFLLALTGGIFSVDFEAPQSLRSIAVMPAVLYFCTVAVAALGREAEAVLKPLPRAWVVAPGAISAALILFFNAHTYFVRQASDFASWNAFSTPETIVGREIAKLGPDYRYLLSPFFIDHPAIRFLAPDIVDQQPLTLPDALPIRQPPDRPVALLIHPDDVEVFNQARELYPNASFEIASSQSVDERPVVYLANLQPADVAAVQGLELKYWPEEAEAETGALPLRTGRAAQVNAVWPQDAPALGRFVAEWHGVLYAPHYGAYNLRLVTPGAGLLEIDGNLIFDGQTEQMAPLVLAQGNHSIFLRAESGPGQVALYWQPPGGGESLIPQWALYAPPVANHGLQGTFYANANWAGQPALQRIDTQLNSYFHLLPLPRPYTVEWRGWLDAPQSGLYHLELQAVQEAQVFLDDQLLIEVPTIERPPTPVSEQQARPSLFSRLVEWLARILGLKSSAHSNPAPPPSDERAYLLDHSANATITLEQGLHEIRVRFKDSADRSRIHLHWTRPDGRREPIPSQYLWPPLGRPPERASAQTGPSVSLQPPELHWVMSLGGRGDQPGQFNEPRDVAVLANGNVVVADTANRRVQIFNAQGSFLQALTGDDLPFEEPLAVAVNSRDEILVLESTLQWVYRYDAAGNFIDRFGGPEARLFHPRGMTVFEDDTVALVDTGSARIAFFNADGTFRGQLGQFGGGPGQFIEPTDVLRDVQGTYFVAEAENDRIQRIDAGGNSLGQWALPPTYAFNGPHLAAGPDGSIFVTEMQSRSLLRYAPDGSLLNQWQTIGPIPLAGPVGIYLDPTTSRLYLTDVLTHQVHVFDLQLGAD